MAKVVAADLQVNTGESVKNIRTAQQELRQLLRSMTTIDEASEEFSRAAKRAGELRDQIGDINQRVNFLANDTPKLAAFTDIASGITGGFAAAQGAAALFGGESEDLIKVLTRVQASMAVLQGVQAVANTLNKDSAASVFLHIQRQRLLQLELVKSGLALRGWSAALAATGIGAVVVALGLLVSWMMKTKDATEQATLALDAQKKMNEEAIKLIDLRIAAEELNITTAELLGKTETQVAQMRLALLDKQLRAQQASLDKERQKLKEMEMFKESIWYREQQAVVLASENRLRTLENEVIKQTNIITKANPTIKRALMEAPEQIKATFANLSRDLLAEAKRLNDESAIIQINGAKDAFNLEMEKQERLAAIRKEYRDQQIADDRELEGIKFQIASQGFGALSQLAAAFAQSQGENGQRLFELSKKLAIAQTIIDTIASAQAAYRSLVALPFVGPGLAVAAAATATLAGLARVQQIRNTKFGGGSNPANVQAQVQQQTGINTTPTFNLPVNQSQFVPVGQNPQGQNAPNQMIRAFVVESDVTGVQQRIRTARNLGELA